LAKIQIEDILKIGKMAAQEAVAKGQGGWVDEAGGK
jgi:hypothetical protein